MRLADIVEELSFDYLGGSHVLDREVARGYASDLMSDVIAHGEKEDIWITLQVHMNVIAVAAMKEVAAIVLSGGRKPSDEVLQKAAEQDVVVLGSELPAFEIAGRIYQLGVHGI